MRGRRAHLVLAATGLLLLGIGVLPTVQARGKAALSLADAVGVDIPRPLAPKVHRQAAVVAGTRVDLYTPGRPAPAIMLIPGAAPAGRADPRVRRLARALARADRLVVVPELALFQGDFTENDLDLLARLAAGLPHHPAVAGDSVVLVGFSFGGAFALLTAANERARPYVRLVVTFGGYVDFVGLIQAATTGVSIVGTDRLAWRPPPEAATALERLALALVPAADRAELRTVLAGGADPGGLSAAARTVFDLVTNTDADRTRDLVTRLPPAFRARLAAFSPASVADRITAPVRAIHARDDPVVPWAELLRLRTAFPRAHAATVDSFTHVDLVGQGVLANLPDLRRVWACTAALLGVQERLFD